MALREHGLSPEDISKISSSAEAKAKSKEREALTTLPLCTFNLLPSSNDIRTKYKEGKGSIIGLLPRPEVKLVKHDRYKCNDLHKPADLLEDKAPNDDRYYSFVEPKQIANFLLGIDTPAKYYRVGYETDWYDDAAKKHMNASL